MGFASHFCCHRGQQTINLVPLKSKSLSLIKILNELLHNKTFLSLILLGCYMYKFQCPLNLHQLLLTNEVQFSPQKCCHLVCLFKASKSGKRNFQFVVKSDRSMYVCNRTLIRPISRLTGHLICLISAINLIGSTINFF